jgi:hypothetical protein
LLFGCWPELLPSFSKACYKLQKHSTRNEGISYSLKLFCYFCSRIINNNDNQL